MRNASLFIFLFAILSINKISAQTRIWHQSDTTNLGNSASRVALDASGNVFAGLTSSNEAAVLKFDTAGSQKWLVAYQSFNAVTLRDMVADAAGNSYFCGNVINPLPAGEDALIVKVSPQGTIQWSPTLNYQNKPDTYAALTIDRSGNIVAVGTSVDSNLAQQLIVTKYTTAGIIVWSRHYSAPGFSYNGDKVATDASGSIYVECDRLGNTSGYDFNVVKFDSSGTLQWEQTINSSAAFNDLPAAMSVDNGGNTYLVGYADSMQGGGTFGFLAKVDAAGNARWTKSMHYNTPNSELNDCKMDGSDNLYITGLDSNNAYVAKVDTTNGDTLWAFHYNPGTMIIPGQATALVCKNNSLYVTGNMMDSIGEQRVLTMKLSSDGHLLWSDLYSGSGNNQNYGSSIVVGNDGNFYVGASTIETNSGQTSATVIRYHETPTGIFEMPNGAPFSVTAYPNPTDKELEFTIDMPTAGHAAMYIYDLAGKQLATVFDRQMDTGKNTTVWNASSLAKGTYLYQMVTPSGRTTGKFVKY